MKVRLSADNRARADTERSTRGPIWERALALTVFTSAAACPLFISLGADSFRLPKEALYRGEAIVIIAIAMTAMLTGGRANLAASLRIPLRYSGIILAVVVWGILAALLSTNRSLSLYALEYTATALVVFGATLIVVRKRSVDWIATPIAIAAVPNAILAQLQASAVWNPFRFETPPSLHHLTTALIGNPNDVGSYLMLATVFLMTAAIATRRRLWWITAAVSAGGVVASGALTAMIALLAAVLAATIVMSQKRTRTIVAIAAFGLGAVVLLPPLRERGALMTQAIAARDYTALTSQRIYSVGTAWAMFLDHPLTGVGPGAFKFNYLPYRKQFNERNPSWYLLRGATENFAEVHCDHVQILAEEGLPGYMVFLAALITVGTISFRKHAGETDARQRFTRAGGFAVAIGFAVLTLAAFPLELAASTQILLHGTAAIIRWGHDEGH